MVAFCQSSEHQVKVEYFCMHRYNSALCAFPRVPREVWTARLHGGWWVLPPPVPGQLHAPWEWYSLCCLRALLSSRALRGRMPTWHLQVWGLALRQRGILLQSAPTWSSHFCHPRAGVHAWVSIRVYALDDGQVSNANEAKSTGGFNNCIYHKCWNRFLGFF